jgi:hypothetical protein
MNSLTLRGVLAEVAALTGQRLERVVPLDPRSLRLDFGSKSLVVSGHPRHGTLFVTAPDDAARDQQDGAERFRQALDGADGKSEALATPT